MEYSEKIRNLRKEKGLSQNKFAKEVGFSSTVISSVERNLIRLTPYYQKKIISTYKLPQDYFVNCTFTKAEKKEVKEEEPKKYIIHHTPDNKQRIQDKEELEKIKAKYSEEIEIVNKDIKEVTEEFHNRIYAIRQTRTIFESIISDIDKLLERYEK